MVKSYPTALLMMSKTRLCTPNKTKEKDELIARVSIRKLGRTRL